MARRPHRPKRHRLGATEPVLTGQMVQDERLRMVDLIRSRGVTAEPVLQAMAEVPRHWFVPAASVREAYGDFPLSIGWGQTISQPFMVAYMLDAASLQANHRVLEIGTGSGYETAILSRLVRSVYTLEIVPALAEQSLKLFRAMGDMSNVSLKTGNGYQGWEAHAPYDRIIVTAAPPRIPRVLIDQLATPGLLVIPVGVHDQKMLIITKTENNIREAVTLPVRFVPMTGG